MRMGDLCAYMRTSHLRATASVDDEFSAPDTKRKSGRNPSRTRTMYARMNDCADDIARHQTQRQKKNRTRRYGLKRSFIRWKRDSISQFLIALAHCI